MLPGPRASTGHAAFLRGLRDAIPIALSYFTVSLAFGLYCTRAAVPPAVAGLFSLTNLSSSGQFAGLQVVVAHGTMLQLALTVLLVNLRYLLMSLSLSQRLSPQVRLWQRFVIGWGVTDEIYALAMASPRVGFAYYGGLMVLPILGWTSGTVTGALVGEVLPASLQSAFGVLLYAMFVSIVVPPATRARPVALVVFGAAGFSLLLTVLPVTAGLQPGWRIILVTCLVAAVAATLLPVDRPAAEAAEVELDSPDRGISGGDGAS